MEMIIGLLFLHFLADFLLQNREMGNKKSEQFIWLFKHISTQWIVFALCLEPFFGATSALIFATSNSITHGIIDWYIWRLYKYSVMVRKPRHLFGKICDHSNKKCFKYWEDDWFYLTIGFDQVLHVSTLILLAKEIL